MLLLIVACWGEPPDTGSTPTTPVQLFPVPTVRILAPTEGSTVSSGEVEVVLEIVPFTFVEPGGVTDDANWPATLSLLWRSPGALLTPRLARAHKYDSPPQGWVNVTLDNVEVAQVTASSFLLSGVADGTHSVGVELRWPDGDTYFPPAVDTNTFVVAATGTTP